MELNISDPIIIACLHRLRVAACATRLRLPKPLAEAPAIALAHAVGSDQAGPQVKFHKAANTEQECKLGETSCLCDFVAFSKQFGYPVNLDVHH